MGVLLVTLAGYLALAIGLPWALFFRGRRRRSPGRNRRALVVVAAVTVVAVAAPVGLFFALINGLSVWGESNNQYFGAAFGIRLDGKALSLSTGSVCPAGTRLIVSLNDFAPGGRIEIETSGRSAKVFPVEPPNAWQPPVELAPGFTWADATLVEVESWSADGKQNLSAGYRVDMKDIEKGSRKHPDEYYFGRDGWLRPEEVAEGDGQALNTVCWP